MAGERASLFKGKKDGDGSKPEPMKNVESPADHGSGTPVPAGPASDSSAGGHIAQAIARHHGERHEAHTRHRTERRDMHGRHRSEHDDAHGRHMTELEDMSSRHNQEMAQAEAAHAAAGPALGSQPAAPGTPTAPA